MAKFKIVKSIVKGGTDYHVPFYTIKRRVFPFVWVYCWFWDSKDIHVKTKTARMRKFVSIRQTAEKQLEVFKNKKK